MACDERGHRALEQALTKMREERNEQTDRARHLHGNGECLVEGCMRPIHGFGYCRECLTELNEALKRPLFQTTKGGMDV